MALDAAGRIIEQDGPDGLTARKVAGAIGYAPGTLFNLFRNQDEMILHLNGRTLDHLCRHLETGRMSGDAEGGVKTVLKAYMGFLERHPGSWNLLFEFSLPDGTELPDWYSEKVEKLLGLLEAAMAPLFGPDQAPDGAQAARVLWAGLHGICSLASSGKLMAVTDKSVAEMAGSLVRHCLAGLRAFKGKN